MGGVASVAIERMKRAAGKAEREAQVHSDPSRAYYADGTAHGLKTAIRILEEERAQEEADTLAFAAQNGGVVG